MSRLYLIARAIIYNVMWIVTLVLPTHSTLHVRAGIDHAWVMRHVLAGNWHPTLMQLVVHSWVTRSLLTRICQVTCEQYCTSRTDLILSSNSPSAWCSDPCHWVACSVHHQYCPPPSHVFLEVLKSHPLWFWWPSTPPWPLEFPCSPELHGQHYAPLRWSHVAYMHTTERMCK